MLATLLLYMYVDGAGGNALHPFCLPASCLLASLLIAAKAYNAHICMSHLKASRCTVLLMGCSPAGSLAHPSRVTKSLWSFVGNEGKGLC